MEYGISLIFFSVKVPEAYRYLLGQLPYTPNNKMATIH